MCTALAAVSRIVPGAVIHTAPDESGAFRTAIVEAAATRIAIAEGEAIHTALALHIVHKEFRTVASRAVPVAWRPSAFGIQLRFRGCGAGSRRNQLLQACDL
jgi:hypothetical protein